nr:hypothetical protein Itr_chr12CG17520 [Ipomoea trifida]
MAALLCSYVVAGKQGKGEHRWTAVNHYRHHCHRGGFAGNRCSCETSPPFGFDKLLLPLASIERDTRGGDEVWNGRSRSLEPSPVNCRTELRRYCFVDVTHHRKGKSNHVAAAVKRSCHCQARCC